MSHFTVLVIGEKPETQLWPFDENLETPKYVSYTKEKLIEKGKKEIEDYKNGNYAKYLANPEKYIAECKNEAHVKYLQKVFPEKLSWSNEQIYQDAIKYEEESNIGENGELYSEYNPKSKWDWYKLGGRWSGLIKLKDGKSGNLGEGSLVMKNKSGIDQAKKGDIENLEELITFAVLKDGEWYERGEMGWWGVVSNPTDESEWGNKVKELLNGLPDETLISIYDCHI